MRPSPVILVCVILGLVTALLFLGFFGLAGTSLALPAAGVSSQDPPASIPAPARADLPEPNARHSSDTVASQAASSYLRVAGFAFKMLTSIGELTPGSNGCVYVTLGPVQPAAYPLALPHGSTLTQLRLYYADTNLGQDGTLRLARYGDEGSFTYVVTGTTQGSGGAGYTSASVSETLDYENYSYALIWTQPVSDASIQLCGVRVAYTPPSIFGVALPMVTTNN